jgi:TRAP-type C4-dicarboxylate transport system substrate-binding protein
MNKKNLMASGVALAALATLSLTPARAADQIYVMKLSTATINDAQQHWMQLYVAMLEKDSGGRIKGQIFPASQLGSIPRQIEGTQFGAIQAYVGPPEFLTGVDDRFQIMTSPGLVKSLDQAIKITEDKDLQKLLFGLGEKKGLDGVALWISAPSSIITRKPVRHLSEFKGLKIRVLASPFANEQIARLGATPIDMTLGDVLPALQQGAIDGAVAQVAVFSTMQYFDASKYITETDHNYIFSMAFLSKKWFDGLPLDLQKILREDATKASAETNPWAKDFFEGQRKVWVQKGGELIELPKEEHDEMMKKLSTVGDDLSKSKPELHAAYETLVAAVKRTEK